MRVVSVFILLFGYLVQCLSLDWLVRKAPGPAYRTVVRWPFRSALCVLVLGGLEVQDSWGAGVPAEAPALGTCVTVSNPQTTTQVCRVLGLVDDGERVRGCAANENCFSTGATSAGKRVSPWLFKQTSGEAAMILTDALKLEGLKILQSKKLGDGDSTRFYILAAEKNVPRQPSGSSIFYEFLVKQGTNPPIILYRVVIDKTIFVYPLQQPIGDLYYLKPKIESIRARTGFRVESELENLPEELSDFETISIAR